MNLRDIQAAIAELPEADRALLTRRLVEQALAGRGFFEFTSRYGCPVTDEPGETSSGWHARLFRSGEFRRGYAMRHQPWQRAREMILADFPRGDYNPDASDYHAGWLAGQEVLW